MPDDATAVRVASGGVADLARAAAYHRQAAALLAEAQRAGMAEPQWPAMQARLLAQRARFAELAAQGVGPPQNLTPTAADVTVVSPGLGDLSPAAVARAIGKSTVALEAADTLLSNGEPPDPRLTWPGPRNAVIYGGYALLVLAIQVVLFFTLDEERALPLTAPLCLLVLPALAWAAGWLTIGALSRSTRREALNNRQIDRSPRLGVAICLAPGVLLCAGLLSLSARR